MDHFGYNGLVIAKFQQSPKCASFSLLCTLLVGVMHLLLKSLSSPEWPQPTYTSLLQGFLMVLLQLVEGVSSEVAMFRTSLGVEEGS